MCEQKANNSPELGHKKSGRLVAPRFMAVGRLQCARLRRPRKNLTPITLAADARASTELHHHGAEPKTPTQSVKRVRQRRRELSVESSAQGTAVPVARDNVAVEMFRS
jgi:hypothetical protein